MNPPPENNHSNPQAAGKTLILGISGASGAIYGRRLLDLLEQSACQVHVIMTPLARQILQDELGITETTPSALLGRDTPRVVVHENNNLYNPLASGSFPLDAMIVCPCSSHSVASIAAGLADTLLLRSAYVTLKQRRRLILVPREMPLTSGDLENMLRISRMGGIICPASPNFYCDPQTIHQVVDTVVGRILELLNLEHGLPIRWNS